MPMTTEVPAGWESLISDGAMLDVVMPAVEDILKNRVQGVQDALASQWPNPSNSGPHVDGRPSVATGTSSEAIKLLPQVDTGSAKVDFMIDDMTNPLTGEAASEYYRYVHFTGASVGTAVETSERLFQTLMDAITTDIRTAAEARLQRLLSKGA